MRQFTGGASNLTYLLRYPERDLILRRPPAGTKARSAHDMAREHRIQAALRRSSLRAADGRAVHRPRVLGSDFYVMERVDGRDPARASCRRRSATEPRGWRALGERFVDLLVELHAVDPAAAGLAELGRGPGYVGRQVAGWSERYRRAADVERPLLRARDALARRRTSRPTSARCVIHNDFRLDNLVLDRRRPAARASAVLDWEMATIGDPLMDLGSSLAYWVQADDGAREPRFRRQPVAPARACRRAREIVARYGERTGRDVADWRFYEVFGLFRLAVIVQQIYYRYHHGQTRNPALPRLLARDARAGAALPEGDALAQTLCATVSRSSGCARYVPSVARLCRS